MPAPRRVRIARLLHIAHVPARRHRRQRAREGPRHPHRRAALHGVPVLLPSLQKARETDEPRNGALAASHVPDIAAHWTPDHVAFLVGCSYSFEAALARAALAPRHTALGRVVPMYRTAVPLCPAGVFAGGTYVVSMRPYPRAAIEAVRRVTRPYVATHGEPVAWGWEALGRLGIRDVNVPDWGEAPVTEEGGPLVVGDEENVPVFWGCGVTPQEAVMRAGGALEGVVMGHAPGHMVVLDVKDSDVF